jgi:hypothetical protein
MVNRELINVAMRLAAQTPSDKILVTVEHVQAALAQIETIAKLVQDQLMNRSFGKAAEGDTDADHRRVA